jgi:hypothetical protein
MRGLADFPLYVNSPPDNQGNGNQLAGHYLLILSLQGI